MAIKILSEMRRLAGTDKFELDDFASRVRMQLCEL